MRRDPHWQRWPQKNRARGKRPAAWPFLAILALASGCVTHEVVLREANRPPDPEPAALELPDLDHLDPASAASLRKAFAAAPPTPEQVLEMPRISALVETDYHLDWQGVDTRSDPLPIDLAATVWTYQPDGMLKRTDVVVESPRPWWQRFPADIVSDLLLPGVFYARKELEVTPLRANTMTIDQLEAAARDAGYGDAPPNTPEAETNP